MRFGASRCLNGTNAVFFFCFALPFDRGTATRIFFVGMV